jgi:hypothetical protein
MESKVFCKLMATASWAWCRSAVAETKKRGVGSCRDGLKGLSERGDLRMLFCNRWQADIGCVGK